MRFDSAALSGLRAAAATGLLAGSVVLLALWLAGVLPETLCIAALLLAAGSFCLCGPGRPRAVEWAAVALIALLAAGALPLPLAATRIAGADRAAQNTRAHDILSAAANAGALHPSSVPAWFSASHNRAGTLRAVTLAVAMLAAFRLSASLPPRHRRLLLYLLLATAAGIAAAGYIGLWVRPQGQTLWWLFPIRHGRYTSHSAVACFINRNHFGGYLAMFAPLALGLLAGALTRRAWASAALALAGFAATAGGCCFSLSRGALLAMAAALFATAAFLILRRRLGGALLAVVILGAGVAAAVYGIRNDAVRARIGSLLMARQDESFEIRTTTWRDAMRIWRDHPLLGVGANGFQMAYPLYRTRSDREYLTHLENEYVQVLAELGVAGALAMLLIAALAAAATARALRSGALDDYAAAGLLGAAVAVASHAVVDFPLRLPLYAVTFAALAGAAMPEAEPGPPADGRRALPGVAPILLVAAIGLAFTSRGMGLDQATRLYGAPAPTAARAVAWAPASWYAWSCLGAALPASRAPGAALLGERCLAAAAECDPLNYLVWRSLGMARLQLDDYDGARAAFAKVRELRPWADVPAIPKGSR